MTINLSGLDPSWGADLRKNMPGASTLPSSDPALQAFATFLAKIAPKTPAEEALRVNDYVAFFTEPNNGQSNLHRTAQKICTLLEYVIGVQSSSLSHAGEMSPTDVFASQEIQSLVQTQHQLQILESHCLALKIPLIKGLTGHISSSATKPRAFRMM